MPGPLRLLNPQLAGQAGWLLPLALVGVLVTAPLVWNRRRRLAGSRRAQACILWGTWLATTAIFFSFAEFWHRYYLVMLAPSRRGARRDWPLGCLASLSPRQPLELALATQPGRCGCGPSLHARRLPGVRPLADAARAGRRTRGGGGAAGRPLAPWRARGGWVACPSRSWRRASAHFHCWRPRASGPV